MVAARSRRPGLIPRIIANCLPRQGIESTEGVPHFRYVDDGLSIAGQEADRGFIIGDPG